jgi:putative acetyltransferase
MAAVRRREDITRTCGDTVIRKYRSEDCDEVLSVWAAASVLAHPFLSATFLESERREIRNVHLPKAETWVWEADGRVVGFISLLGNEVGAHRSCPSLARPARGRGVQGQSCGQVVLFQL